MPQSWLGWSTPIFLVRSSTSLIHKRIHELDGEIRVSEEMFEEQDKVSGHKIRWVCEGRIQCRDTQDLGACQAA